MSDKLKKYFLEQRAAFDVEQPPKEVWPHIEQGLNDKSTPLKAHIKSQRTAFDVETPPPFLWDRIENKLSENEPTLQKHIEDQRADFDVELPPNSLWERIENKLDTTQEEWEVMTEEGFDQLSQASPIRRAKLSGIKRNLRFIKKS